MNISKHLIFSKQIISTKTSLLKPLGALTSKQHRFIATTMSDNIKHKTHKHYEAEPKGSALNRKRIVLRRDAESDVSFSENDSDYELVERVFLDQKKKKKKKYKKAASFDAFSASQRNTNFKAAYHNKADQNSMDSDSSDLDIIENFASRKLPPGANSADPLNLLSLEQVEKPLSQIAADASEQSFQKRSKILQEIEEQHRLMDQEIRAISSFHDPSGVQENVIEFPDEVLENLKRESEPAIGMEVEPPLDNPITPNAKLKTSVSSTMDKIKLEASPSETAQSLPENDPAASRRALFEKLTSKLKSKNANTHSGDKKMFLMTQRPNMVEQMHKAGSEQPQVSEKHKKVVVPNILSEEQLKVIELAKSGVSMFYTGAAGTGKSVLLKAMIKELRQQFEPGEVVVTASTGLAACNIGGITLHSFAGVGLGNENADHLLKKVRRSRKSKEKWLEVKVLIIDEISMIDAEFLDKLDYIAKRLKKSVEPFGGIQLIFCGDFFQLPPVVKTVHKQGIPATTDMGHHFAFNSKAWKESIKVCIVLQKVFRQKGDSRFVDMLNEIRMGNVSSTTEEEFKHLSRELLLDDNIVPTALYPTRREVENANNVRLASLKGTTVLYKATEGGTLEDPNQRRKILDNFLAPDELQLKVGAQVMMIKNIDSTLVNGSLGKVIGFMNRETYALQKHHSEVSDDDSVFDFLNAPPPVTSSIDTKENTVRKIAIRKDPKRQDNEVLLPYVQFYLPDGSSRFVMVEPEEWVYEDEIQKPLVTKQQLPLILAWSLSIHKSQGLTLTFCTVDLSRIFEKGQAYVALSRAVSRKGLQVLNFRKEKIFSHNSVVEFYNSLSSANEAVQEYMSSKAFQDSVQRLESKQSISSKLKTGKKKSSSDLSNTIDPFQRSLDTFSMISRETSSIKSKSIDQFPEVLSKTEPLTSQCSDYGV